MGLGKSAARSFILSTLLDSTRLDSTVPLDSREKGDSPFVLSLLDRYPKESGRISTDQPPPTISSRIIHCKFIIDPVFFSSR